MEGPDSPREIEGGATGLELPPIPACMVDYGVKTGFSPLSQKIFWETAPLWQYFAKSTGTLSQADLAALACISCAFLSHVLESC